MKKIVLVLVAAMVLVFTGCAKKETISMPFDVADVNNIEMYRNAEPVSYTHIDVYKRQMLSHTPPQSKLSQKEKT